MLWAAAEAGSEIPVPAAAEGTLRRRRRSFPKSLRGMPLLLAPVEPETDMAEKGTPLLQPEARLQLLMSLLTADGRLLLQLRLTLQEVLEALAVAAVLTDLLPAAQGEATALPVQTPGGLMKALPLQAAPGRERPRENSVKLPVISTPAEAAAEVKAELREPEAPAAEAPEQGLTETARLGPPTPAEAAVEEDTAPQTMAEREAPASW